MVIVLENIYNEVKKEFKECGVYLLDKDEIEKIRNIILVNGGLNFKIVG